MTVFYNYDEWEECLHPCDLILFSGNGLIGQLIKLFEGQHINRTAEWNHVGIVCPEDIIKVKNKEKEQTCIIESLITIPGDPLSIERNRCHNGLQIRDMREVIQNFIDKGGIVGCFHLNDNSFPITLKTQRNLSEDNLDYYLKNLHHKDQFKQFWKKYSKSKYDCYNCGRAVGISLPGFSKNTKSHMFCSEAVIRMYQHMNIVSNDIDAEKISPDELGKWCGDVKGDCPFYLEPDILMKEP